MESGLLTCVKCKSPPERSHRLLLLPGRNCLFLTCLCKTCKTGTRSRTIQIIINFDLVYKQVSSPLPSFLSLLSLPSLLSLLCSQIHTAHPLSCLQPASLTMSPPYLFVSYELRPYQAIQQPPNLMHIFSLDAQERRVWVPESKLTHHHQCGCGVGSCHLPSFLNREDFWNAGI